MPSPLTPDQKKRELERRETEDALRHYTPWPTQKRCLESTARFRLLHGPNRVGKSGHGAYEIAAAARRRHPTKTVETNGVYLILAPGREQLKDPWGKKLLRESELIGPWANKPMIPPWEIEKVWTTGGAGEPVPRDIVLKNGNRILLMVSDIDKIRKLLKGKNLLGVLIDEDAGTPELVAELYSRLLESKGWILWGATDDEGNEAFDTFLRQCENPDYPEHEAFCIPPEESPAVTTADRESLRGVLDQETFAIKHLGTRGRAGSNRVFQHWDRAIHVRAEPYAPGATDNYWIGYDPGWRHPCGISVYAINRENPFRLIQIAFFNYKYGTRFEHLKSMVEFMDGRTVECVTCDPAILKTESNGQSYFSSFEREMKDSTLKVMRPLCTGRNRNEDCFPQIEEWLERHWFEVDPFGPGCEIVADQLERYSWDAKSRERKVIKKNDEGPDTAKYVISKRPAWIDYGQPNLPTNWRPPPPKAGDPLPVEETLCERHMRLARNRTDLDMPYENSLVRSDLSF